jgi:hypothetical protein
MITIFLDLFARLVSFFISEVPNSRIAYLVKRRLNRKQTAMKGKVINNSVS